jgi:prepilin-type N-terminal cleavage/methylation domain-containing protein
MELVSYKKGFTLIEILIVVAIIGIMSAIVLAYLDGAKAKGRDTKRIADIKQIEQALEIYFDTCNRYPTPLRGGRMNPTLATTCGNSLPRVPQDPQASTGKYYGYAVSASPVRYHICATLELGNAQGLGKSGQGPIPGTIDPCNGTAANVFDLYGPQ